MSTHNFCAVAPCNFTLAGVVYRLRAGQTLSLPQELAFQVKLPHFPAARYLLEVSVEEDEKVEEVSEEAPEKVEQPEELVMPTFNREADRQNPIVIEEKLKVEEPTPAAALPTPVAPAPAPSKRTAKNEEAKETKQVVVTVTQLPSH